MFFLKRIFQLFFGGSLPKNKSTNYDLSKIVIVPSPAKLIQAGQKVTAQKAKKYFSSEKGKEELRESARQAEVLTTELEKARRLTDDQLHNPIDL